MNKAIAVAFLLVSSPMIAATGPEAQRAGASDLFSGLAAFKPTVSPAKGVPAKVVTPSLVAIKSSRYVHVSGSVNLNGSGNYSKGSSFVYVNFSGNASVTDSTGRITSNYTWFNRNVGCNVSGGWVNCNDYPQWSVQFYENGRYVGSGTVSGNLHASAYAPNGFFTANSYLSLSGDVMVSEP